MLASRTTLLGLVKHATFVEKVCGPLPLIWVYLHVLREMAQHCGHADIRREQLLQARHAPGVPPAQATPG